MKTISLITRRTGMAREAFRDYYEGQHCTLAMRYFPYQLYTRNHLAGNSEPGFDCISEFGMTDEFRASAGNVMESESRSRLLADELRFMQPECIRVALVKEMILQPQNAALTAPEMGGTRWVMLFRANHRADDYAEKMHQRLVSQLQQIADIRSASLDIVCSDGAGRFGFDALLWLTLTEGSAAAEALAQAGDSDGLVHTLQVATFATPESELEDRFEAYLP